MTREEELQQFAEQNTKGLYLDRHNLIQMVKQGAEWADQHPHWIPVEEKLPKKDGKYLFYDEVLGHEVSIYYDGVTLVPSITHWMPLPSIENIKKK